MSLYVDTTISSEELWVILDVVGEPILLLTDTGAATGVVKVALKEIIPRFGLPQSFQSDSGPSFTSQITQRVAKTLGIKCYLHSTWQPQSSGKEERANPTLK